MQNHSHHQHSARCPESHPSLSEAKAAGNCQEDDYGSFKFRHKEVVSKRLETEWH